MIQTSHACGFLFITDTRCWGSSDATPEESTGGPEELEGSQTDDAEAAATTTSEGGERRTNRLGKAAESVDGAS